jgi:tetratricopeptide (TPR) repeat protein
MGVAWFSPVFAQNHNTYAAGWAFAARASGDVLPAPNQLAPYLNSVNNLADPETLSSVYHSLEAAKAVGVANAKVAQLCGEGRCAEALELARQTLERAEKELGNNHPATLASLNNLAFFYKAQGRYGEAEPLYKNVLEALEHVLGQDDPNTLSSVNNLAALYYAQGRFAQAEPLYRRALEGSERVRGRQHPDTLGIKGNLTALLTSKGKTEEALGEFQSLENGLAFWLDAEFEGPEGGGLRRRILEAKSGHHDAMFSFALKYPSEASARLAADVILRWKKRPLQDEAYLVNLMRDSDDPNIVAAAQAVHERSAALAAAALAPKPAPGVVESLKQSLDAAEADLRQRSESYRRYVQAKRATAEAVQKALPGDGAYIEYRFFNPFDFDQNAFGKLHLLAVVLRPGAAPTLFDLGEAGPILDAQQALIHARSREENGVSLRALRGIAYDKLIAPLKDRLAGVKTVIISPDGPLNALPFDALLKENGEGLLHLYPV